MEIESEKAENIERETPFPAAGNITFKEAVADKIFNADSRASAEGPLSYYMEVALVGSLNQYRCWIAFVDERKKFQFEITAVDWDPKGMTVEEFLPTLVGNFAKTCVGDAIVNTTVVQTSSIGLAYRKKGTCRIHWSYAGNDRIGASDQTDAESYKQMVPVHYRV